MSVQDMSQFVAILALDRTQRDAFLQKETRHQAIDEAVHRSGYIFDVDAELPLLQAGDMGAIFDYLHTNDRPVPDPDPGG